MEHPLAGRPQLVTLGEFLLDVSVALPGPPRPGDDLDSVIRVGGGGQAANVAVWAAELGAEAAVITRLGDDLAGRMLAAELAARGVELLAPPPAGITGATVVLVEPGGARSFLRRKGAAMDLTPEMLDRDRLRDADLLHVSGYALFSQPVAAAAAAAAAAARVSGTRVSVDLASAAGIQALGSGAMLAALERIRPELVFGTEPEFEALGRERPGNWLSVVKLGARGCLVAGQVHAAEPARVVDTTGAGDAFAAAFCVAHLAGRELGECARAGLRAAARAVSHFGAWPRSG